MKFSPGKFNAFLNGLGQTVAWRRAYDCPCADANSGAAKYGCPQCNAVGIIWDPVVNAVTALAGQKVQRAWAMFGLWEQGDVVITIPSDSALYDMGEFDRVEFSDSSTPYSLKLTRGQDDVMPFTVPVVDRVFWLDVNSDIVEGGIPMVAADGSLSWTSGEPPAGTQYSITGRRRPEYFCWGEFPQDRAHHGGEALPRRVVLRSFDLFRKGT